MIARLRAAWLAVTGTAPGFTVAFGLLVLACTLLAATGPRAGLELRTRALQHDLRAPGQQDAVYESTDFVSLASQEPAPFGADTIGQAGTRLAANLRAENLPLAPDDDWSGLSTGFYFVTGAPRAYSGGAVPRMELLYRSPPGPYMLLSAGVLPRGATVAGSHATFQVAVTSATAARFGVRPGSRLSMGPYVTLAVTGIIQVQRPGTRFWTADPIAAAPQLMQVNPNEPPFWNGAAFIGPAELGKLGRFFSPTTTQIAWNFPLTLGHLTASQAPGLQARLTQASSVAGLLSAGNGTPVTVYSGASAELSAFDSQDSAASPLLAILEVSLTVVAGVTMLLAGVALAERRRDDFVLLHARGASRLRIALVALRAAAVVAIPAAAVAAAVASVVTAGYPVPLAWWLAAGTLLAALACPPLAAVRGLPRPSARRRGVPSARQRRRGPAIRLTVEVLLVAAAVGGLAVAYQQGRSAAGSGGPLASITPVLVALPAAILVMRCYPPAVRGLLRLARRRRGITVVLGLARAASSPAIGVVAVCGLILALAVGAFGAMVHSAVVRGQVTRSWQQTGADVVVDAGQVPQALTPSVQRSIAAIPGVSATATVAQVPGDGPGGAITVAVIQPARYAALLASSPLPAIPADLMARRAGSGGTVPVPVLIGSGSGSAAIRGRRPVRLEIGSRSVLVRPVGKAPAIPGVAANLLVPSWALPTGVPPPTVMLLAGPTLGGQARAAILHAAPGVQVRFRSTALTALTRAALPRAVFLAFTAGSIAAGVLGLLVVLIMLTFTAQAREQTLLRLRTMGLEPGQARAAAAIESLPLVLAGVAGGIACAAVLAPLTGSIVNLAVFTGSPAAVPVRPQPLPLAAAGAGLLAFSMLLVVCQAVLAGRRNQASELRTQVPRG